MKKSRHLIGLPVIELSTGQKLGITEALAINPDKGCVEFLLLSREKWYGEMRALPYDSTVGIGEDAVTIEKRDRINKVSDNHELIAYLEKGIEVIKSEVITKTGKYVGIVSEFLIEEDTGKINCFLVTDKNGNQISIPGDKVFTYGPKSLIVEEDYGALQDEQKEPFLPEEELTGQGNDLTDLLDTFETRQRQSLIGKRVAKTIRGDNFHIIIEKGGIINEEVIEKALAMDKYIELVMNVVPEG